MSLCKWVVSVYNVYTANRVGWGMVLLDPNAIGERVRQRRKDRQLSQRELAQVADISHSYVSHLEKGMYPRPGVDMLKKIGDALGASVEELLGVRSIDEYEQLGVLVEVPARYTPARADTVDVLLSYVSRLNVFDPVAVIAEWAALPTAEQDLVVSFIRMLSARQGKGGEASGTG